jgi:CRISPR/Cas system-associated exonuclease Cas4 (RecB family)
VVEYQVHALSNQRPPIIRASEIGEYVYCARAWWLRRALGWEPEGHERREFGTVLHHRHGRAVAGSRALLLVAGALLLAGLLLIVVGRGWA